MAKDPVTLAQAVADDIAGDLVLPEEFTVTRCYRVPLALDKLTGLRLFVVPNAREWSPESRATDSHTARIDVAVVRKLPDAVSGGMHVDTDAEVAELDRCMRELVEPLGDFLNRLQPSDFAGANATKVEQPILYSPDYLANDRVFLSLFTVTFQFRAMLR